LSQNRLGNAAFCQKFPHPLSPYVNYELRKIASADAACRPSAAAAPSARQARETPPGSNQPASAFRARPGDSARWHDCHFLSGAKCLMPVYGEKDSG
jgi:hypothetical protein